MNFSPPHFLKHTNIYEVNIRQYTPEGTFNAFAAHLPRLKEMGVQILWLMPIHPIGIIKRKGTLGSYYSIKDHKAVNPEFGTDEDLQKLIVQIHAAGMKVIIDWVANHTAWDHVWTNTNPDFFIRDASGNFLPPYDWDDVIQIDHTNKNEQAAMRNAMQYWVTHFNIDGFRADLAHLTPLEFWKDARTQLAPLKKDLIWLAETEEPAYHEAFDISYTWQWMHATEKFVKKECTLSYCVQLLKEQKNIFPSDAQRLWFTSNHDENSWNGTEYEKYGVFAKALAVFSCTYPGIPLVYNGQELPNNKRLKFFEKDCIDWTPEVALKNFYAVLLAFKKRHLFLNDADTEIFFADEPVEQDILCYRLISGQDCVLVCLNLSNKKCGMLINMPIAGEFKNIFSGETVVIKGEYFFAAETGEFTVLEMK